MVWIRKTDFHVLLLYFVNQFDQGDKNGKSDLCWTKRRNTFLNFTPPQQTKLNKQIGSQMHKHARKTAKCLTIYEI